MASLNVSDTGPLDEIPLFELAARLNDPSLTIVDVPPATAYLQGAYARRSQSCSGRRRRACTRGAARQARGNRGVIAQHAARADFGGDPGESLLVIAESGRG